MSIAIIGFGSAGQRALAELRKLRPGTRFLIVTRQIQSGNDVLFTRDVRDVEDFRPHAVVLAGPASNRVDTLEALSNLSVPLFVEKPLAMTLRAGRIASNLLVTKTSITQLGYNLRFSQTLRFFRDLVMSERLGKVQRFSAETGQFLPDWRPDRDYRDSVSARSDLGGGVLLELSHEIDYLRWIFGSWDWVSAWTGRTSTLDLDVEDTALVTVGIMSQTGRNPLVGQVSLDFVRQDKTRIVTAVCENGTLRWDGIAGRVEMFDRSESLWRTLASDSPTESTYGLQWKSFLSIVESGRKPEVSIEDGLEVLRSIEAIRSSALSDGKRVSLRSERQ